MTTEKAFLILHGWQNHRPEGHWQHWLAGELTRLGHRVDYPQLPDPDDPDLESWLEELRRRLDALAAQGGERVVVCHSLAVPLWLHAVARGPESMRIDVDRVLLVAPPSREVLTKYEEVAGFAPPVLPTLPALPGTVRLVGTDDDPHCAGGAAEHYGRPLALDTDTVPGGAHLDLDAGYGPWPAVLAWCLDPSVRIVGN
ncbi:RBBP9/YdeN family alpha/beta hydrolase [Streptomyces sp. NPDC052236]|uniref:RBBP9/YdeN family alpha/beta hydrolase n=1 Tax=Streptomyces sp. NPDC052236 TaxID=3365686 RepID=UPI0037D59904